MMAIYGHYGSPNVVFVVGIDGAESLSPYTIGMRGKMIVQD